ncbi:hypothetical protein L3Q82_003256 [Scortum barcoo]|uniref:Uncharacterized protein n=1 Tax=Scortum barcoo TaxID=214431 RepID=A0ACB8VRQ1_9TELE|nr:hypothetical protein L3Q82_003256 [Scortum barcoo]
MEAGRTSEGVLPRLLTSCLPARITSWSHLTVTADFYTVSDFKFTGVRGGADAHHDLLTSPCPAPSLLPPSPFYKMAPSSWPSPWRRPPPPPPLLLMLPFILASCFLSESASTTPFPKDLEPINVSRITFQVFRVYFRTTTRCVWASLDFQRLLRINHMLLYIAARDHVFAVNLTTASEEFMPQLDECYNYVKVLVPRNDETLFACGTNAFNPTCRNYKFRCVKHEAASEIFKDEVGHALVVHFLPAVQHRQRRSVSHGGDFYSATMTDFLASDAVIYRSLGDGRPVLRTVKYDSKWLREPHFLHAIDYGNGNYVYFFLSEIAVAWSTPPWARLVSTVRFPGDSFFLLDVDVPSVSDQRAADQPEAGRGRSLHHAGQQLAEGERVSLCSIPGSAVCAFYMDDIEKVFNGKFKEQRTSDSSWTPVPDEQVPRPRPGTCAGDGPAAEYKSSVQFPDEMLTFIKSYPLMEEAVPSVNDRPCFTRTSSRSKLTQIVVDVSAGPYKDRTVMFLGSDDGRVLKVLASTHPNDSFGSKLLEDIDVYNPSKCNVQGQEDRRVLGLELDKDHHALFVAFTSCVIRVPLSRCSQHGACKNVCVACLASRDPYCIWLRTGSCANMAPGFKAGFEQDIEGDHSFHPDSCHADVLATTRNQESAADSAYGKKLLFVLDCLFETLGRQMESSDSLIKYDLRGGPFVKKRKRRRTLQ